ncbi:SEC-C domain-containing protein [Streptomyces sp. NPDC057428]|uniref:SEC-C domain-containing protein n=1 Tax=Streptomyces sp. NPDC057428 TaxID=3346129 RepID=UPI00369896E9
MNEVLPSGQPATPYTKFRTALGGDPSAAECERWAIQHPGDPEEPCALVDAGWATVRSGGDGERALALFRRAAEFGGEFGRDGRVGVIDCLYTAGHEAEADTAERALRLELASLPLETAVLRIYDDMVEVLCEAERSELALEWCRMALDRVGGRPEGPELTAFRRRALIDRGILRRELGIDLDEEDLAAEAEADASVREVSELVRERLDALSARSGPGLPDAGEAFDSVVLRWARQDFEQVRERWPEPTAHYGDDYDAYAARIQREARGYDEAGAARVHLVVGTLVDFEAYALREGRDPAGQETRQEYGEWRSVAHPEQTLLWPPARNGPCWCDSGRKYKKCCGSPAKN